VTSSTTADDLAGTFRAHRAELVRLAAFILTDWGAGEDVVQDVFARMHGWHDGIAGLMGSGSGPNTCHHLRKRPVSWDVSAMRAVFFLSRDVSFRAAVVRRVRAVAEV